MPVFRDSDHFYETIGGLMDQASRDPKVGPKIAKSGIVLQFRYSDPEAITTVNGRHKPTSPGVFVDVIHGDCDLTPDVVMSMAADISHAFWHGKVNLMAALSKKQIVTQGSIPKILKLLPAVQPLYKQYPDLLIKLGYPEMVMR